MVAQLPKVSLARAQAAMAYTAARRLPTVLGHTAWPTQAQVQLVCGAIAAPGPACMGPALTPWVVDSPARTATVCMPQGRTASLARRPSTAATAYGAAPTRALRQEEYMAVARRATESMAAPPPLMALRYLACLALELRPGAFTG